MIQAQLNLRLSAKQDAILAGWWWDLPGVWNRAIRKIRLEARDGIYDSPKDLPNLLANHGVKMEIPGHTLPGLLAAAHDAWKRYFKKTAKKARFKDNLNGLASLPFPDPLRAPVGNLIAVPERGKVRFHRQDIPESKIKCGCIVKRASGWYLCLFIDAEPKAIARKGCGPMGERASRCAVPRHGSAWNPPALAVGRFKLLVA